MDISRGIICVSRYRSGRGAYDPGEVIEGPEELLAALVVDSPGSFASIAEQGQRAIMAGLNRMESGAELRQDEDVDDGVMTTENTGAVKLPEHRTGQKRVR